MILVGMAAASAALIVLKTRLRSRFDSRTSAPSNAIPTAPLQDDGSGDHREAPDADLLRVALAAFSVHQMNRAIQVTPPRSPGWASPRRMRQSAPLRKKPFGVPTSFLR